MVFKILFNFWGVFSFLLLISMQIFAGVKWHPGHYLHGELGLKKGAFNWGADQIYADLENNSIFSGLQIRFKWSDLETSKGVYNFNLHSAVLDC